MSSIVIANFTTGFETDRDPYLLSNDAFPVLEDFYLWRGKILRKRGTTLMGRLQNNLTSKVLGTVAVDGSFTNTIKTTLSLNAAATIAPSTLVISIAGGGEIFTDVLGIGTLTGSGGGTGTINYATSVITLNTNPASSGQNVSATFGYYPNLPSMGIRNQQLSEINYPETIFFNTRYSYQFDETANAFYDVNFFKGTGTQFLWSGTDYQQFWTTNYQGAMWATNNNPGFNFVTATYNAGTGTAVITFTFLNGGVAFTTLKLGDVLWFNEWGGAGVTINGLSGTVTALTNPAIGQYQVTFTAVQTVNGTGIAQLRTNTIPGQDGIKWYDGDPVSDPTKGWVNFAPPLQQYSASVTNPDYLVGAKMIIPFKNRLLFFGCWIRKSNTAAVYYKNRLVYSQVGTVYYSSPTPVNQTVDGASFYQNVAGRGGFLNAPIDQEVVTVADNEDVLITQYEKKSLKLIFNFDDALPFIYQTINSEFGAQNTFTGIPLDVGIVSISDYGLTITTQVSSQRIDLKILDRVFDISTNSNNSKRVCAVRDYRNELIYFTYVTETAEYIYPQQSLVYNYRDNSWALFEERYTSYGYYRYGNNFTWATLPYKTWADWSNPWNFGNLGARFPNVVGGNQQGFIMVKSDRGTRQDQSQYVSNIATVGVSTVITSPNHNLQPGNYVEFFNILGDASMIALNKVTFLVLDTPTANTFTIDYTDAITGTYEGNGTYRIKSRPNLQSKQFTVAWPQLKKTRFINELFMFEKTDNGQVELTMFANQDSNKAINNPLVSPFLIYSDVVQTSPEALPIQIRNISLPSIGDSVATSYSVDLLAAIPALSKGVVPGSVNIIIASPGNSTFVDDSDKNFICTGLGNGIASTIDYKTGDCTLVFTQPIDNSQVTASFAYYPLLVSTQSSSQLWHRLNNSFIGDTLQFGITLNDEQMRNNDYSDDEIMLHAVVISVAPSSTLGFYL